MSPFSVLPKLVVPALVLGVGLPSSAAVSPELMAKFIKVIATNAGSPGRVDLKDAVLIKALDGLGVTADKAAKVAFATSLAEVKALKAEGKLVICNSLDMLPAGGSIAIVDEDGKAAVYLHTGHINESGAKVSPAILRIGKQN